MLPYIHLLWSDDLHLHNPPLHCFVLSCSQSKRIFFFFYSCLLYIETTPFPFLFYFILKAKIFRLRNFYIKLKTETKICTPANMSASGKAMWTSILFFLACFLPNALSEETKEHPSIGKEGFFKCVLLF